MELIELRELIGMLRTAGVTSYRNGDLELVLGAEPPINEGGEREVMQPEAVSEDEAMKVLAGLENDLYSRAFTSSGGQA